MDDYMLWGFFFFGIIRSSGYETNVDESTEKQ
jgi:hypothetical protein